MDYLANFRDYVLYFLIVLSVVVFVHEMGHFLVARFNGVRVDVFSIGFGHELFGFNDRRGTRWKFSLIPLGGYVKMFGDADASSARPDTSEDAPPMTEEERAVSYHHKRLGQRAAIIVAGPLSNFVFGILVFALMFMTVGQPVTPSVVGQVTPGSAAESAGVLSGDKILSIDGTATPRFSDVQRLVQLSSGAPLHVLLSRQGREVEVSVTPRFTEVTDNFGNVRRVPLLGISVSRAEEELVRHGPSSAVEEAFRQTYNVVSGTFVTVGQMIAGTRSTEDLGGPLRIAQVSGQAAKGGWESLVMFTAFLSINLGLINLFPIPLLDGGHLLFHAIEAVLRRPLTERAQEFGLRVGLVLVLGLMVFSTWNDLVQLKIWDFFISLIP
ncbi:MAG: RIP metalloprotease RseP [Alphaproteobacteria bacterium]|nr:RIP metalloprotease RseP [Alphaproteobacteria bacterium]